MRSLRPSRWNALTSSSTQRDCAACGEQMTIRLADCAIASLTFTDRFAAVGSSSRSRKTGARREGMTPADVTMPTSRGGIG